jgi:hypothetical protein
MDDPFGIGPLKDLGACNAALDHERQSGQDRQLYEGRPPGVFSIRLTRDCYSALVRFGSRAHSEKQRLSRPRTAIVLQWN